jgi:hypothetical protein
VLAGARVAPRSRAATRSKHLGSVFCRSLRFAPVGDEKDRPRLFWEYDFEDRSSSVSPSLRSMPFVDEAVPVLLTIVICA